MDEIKAPVRPKGRAGRPGHQKPRDRAAAALLGVALVGALVAVALGTYGRSHQPTGRPLALVIGFTGMAPMKAWLATAGVLLGVGQLLSAAWMWGRLPVRREAPHFLAQAHRWCGSLAFVLTLPVAYHCLWSLGFATESPRTLLHSVFGCAFYGVFASKMLALRTKRLPGWLLPVAGGLLFALLVGAWATASLWYFTQPGVPLR
ncbi:DUF6529 family protein [Kribbella sp. NPDC051770]|uniref:DUF6529 family protein n=1 Tax=Kribbella sp. NPDC051770 TaxID=3155413 RepID=UPI003420C3D4